MTNAPAILKALVVYSICLPLAIFLGYLLATPLDRRTFLLVGVLALVLVTPFLLKWHHPLLVLSWNMSAVVFILPGRPWIWMVMAGTSLVISVLQYALNKQRAWINVPAITWPLSFLTLVVLITAQLTGGIGFNVLGSEVSGGKRYLTLVGAIIGYFALTCVRVPPERAMLYVGLFFLGGVTAFIGNLVPYVHPSLYFMFMIFPVEKAGLDIIAGEIVRGEGMLRLQGLSFACISIYCFLLARYGIKGILDMRKLWRLLLFLSVAVLSTIGGYRSVLLLLLLTFMAQFYFEGLWRSRLMPALVILFLFVVAITIPFTDKLPMSIQRSLSVLPVRVDPVAALDAKVSTEWRLDIWRRVLPEVPKYVLLGKGYAMDTREMQMTGDMIRVQRVETMEMAIMAGDYHNGPLSVIIPLGIFGVIGFVWFLAAAVRVLYRNYRYSLPELKMINTLLLSLFIARTFQFIFVFGGFYSELMHFTGIIGLSVALNGGVRKPSDLPTPLDEPQPAKGLARLFPLAGSRAH